MQGAQPIFGIVQQIPNEVNTTDHNSKTIGQCVKDDLLILHYFCTYNTNLESTPSSYINYQQSKWFPKLQSKQKTQLWKEPFAPKYFSKERTEYIHLTKPEYILPSFNVIIVLYKYSTLSLSLTYTDVYTNTCACTHTYLTEQFDKSRINCCF